MTLKKYVPGLFYFLGFSFLAAPIYAHEIECPQSITEKPSVSKKEKKWRIVSASGERPLERVGIYLGDTSEYSAQVPDSSEVSQGEEKVVWNIVRAPEDTFWVGCEYTGTTALLFQKLNPASKICTATYELLSSGKRLSLKSLICL